MADNSDSPTAYAKRPAQIAKKDRLILETLNNGFWRTDPETGKIYSLRGYRLSGPIELTGNVDRNGYRMHSLGIREDGKATRVTVSAHRVIWLSVYGLIPRGMMVDHVDKNKLNNAIGNLRLVDYFGNAANRRSYRCENHPQVKLSWEKVRGMRDRRRQGESVMSLAIAYEMSICYTRQVLQGNYWPENEDPGRLNG